MVRHVVLLRFRAQGRGAAVAAAVQALRALPSQIPEIAELTVGPDRGSLSGTCDLALVVDFRSAADYLVYAEHPAHLRVIEEQITPFAVERHRAQIEFDD
ncbi:MAG: Dabb family protein [Candidatus Dormibacteria bacterium]